MLILLADTIAVDGITLGGGLFLAIAAGLLAFATVRANSTRNTERLNKKDEDDMARDNKIGELQEWRAYEKGRRKGAGDNDTQTWEPKRR